MDLSAEFSGVVRVQHSSESICPDTHRTLVHYNANLRSSTNDEDFLTFRIVANDTMERLNYGEYAEVEGQMEEGAGGAAFKVVADLLHPLRDLPPPETSGEMTIAGRVSHVIDSHDGCMVIEVMKTTGVLYFRLEFSAIPPDDLEFDSTDLIADVQGTFAAQRFHPDNDRSVLGITPLIEPTFRPPTTTEDELYAAATTKSRYGSPAVKPQLSTKSRIHQVGSEPHPILEAVLNHQPASAVTRGQSFDLANPLDEILLNNQPSSVVALKESFDLSNPSDEMAAKTTYPPGPLPSMPKRVYAWVSKVWQLNPQVGCGDYDLATDGDVEQVDSGSDSSSADIGLGLSTSVGAYGTSWAPFPNTAGIPSSQALPHLHRLIPIEPCYSDTSGPAFSEREGQYAGGSDGPPLDLNAHKYLHPPPSASRDLTLQVERCYSETSRLASHESEGRDPGSQERTPTQRVWPLPDGAEPPDGLPHASASESHPLPFQIERCFSETSRVASQPSEDLDPGSRDRTPTLSARPLRRSGVDQSLLPPGSTSDDHPLPLPIERCFSQTSRVASNEPEVPGAGSADRTPTWTARPLPDEGKGPDLLPASHFTDDPLPPVEACHSEESDYAIDERTDSTEDGHEHRTQTRPRPRPLFISDDPHSGPEHDPGAYTFTSEEAMSPDSTQDSAYLAPASRSREGSEIRSVTSRRRRPYSEGWTDGGRAKRPKRWSQ